MADQTLSRRVEFIDLLRGWAVIVMIETHVVNATLTAGIASSGFFQYVKFINGLVAPSFLFASGLAYAVTTHRKATEYLRFGTPLFKQIGRLLFILGIGYMLHLPQFSLSALLSGTTAGQWKEFFQADVLHCIAVSLLLLQVFLLIVRSELQLYRIALIMAAGVLFATPLMWGVDFHERIPWIAASYLNGLHHSLFPLFPWLVFLFAGAVVGYSYIQAREAPALPDGRPTEVLMMRGVVGWGITLMVLSVLIEPLASRVYPTYDYWRYSPSFVMLRLGIVMLLCALMFWWEQQRGVRTGSPITLIGRESLIVYVVHLMLIYGDFGPFNFQRAVGHGFSYAEAGGVTVFLLVLMYVLARVWNAIKHGSTKRKRVVNAAIVIAMVAVFLLTPGG